MSDRGAGGWSSGFYVIANDPLRVCPFTLTISSAYGPPADPSGLLMLQNATESPQTPPVR